MISFKTGAFIYGVLASGFIGWMLIDIEKRIIELIEITRKEKRKGGEIL